MQRVKLEMCYLLNVCLYINDYEVFKNFIQVNKKTQMALKCRKINICPIMDFTKEFKLMYENIETLCLLLECTPNELFIITEGVNFIYTTSF